MVERDHPALSLSRQCRLLSIGRSSLYYAAKGESAETLALMRRIDELFLKYPFYGARQMVRHLRREGVCIGRGRAGRLMRLMGLQAIYRAPRTSDPHPEHRVYPYLLRGLAIERPNQVWCADITYIPVNRGFLYLVAIMDWASRYVLAWQLSNTLDASFCTDALDEALARHGAPEIFNTDQGSQFTSFVFTGRLQAAGIRISMDGTSVLCLHTKRVVAHDNTVRHERRVLQIPASPVRHHYVKATVRVHEYPDGTLALFHGPRCLARYQADGEPIDTSNRQAA